MNITVTTAKGELLAHCALDECAREIRALALDMDRAEDLTKAVAMFAGVMAAQFEAAARAANGMIKTEIADVPGELREIASGLRAAVDAIRARRPDVAVMNETSMIVVRIAALGSVASKLQALIGAGRMTGIVKQTMAATKSERWTHEEIVAARRCSGEKGEGP